MAHRTRLNENTHTKKALKAYKKNIINSPHYFIQHIRKGVLTRIANQQNHCTYPFSKTKISDTSSWR